MAAGVDIMHNSPLITHAQSSATTATVREHACLFTHDLRRKQKRWQDGRLKYHTFNRRVMVYDDRGNFVGDTHWREEYDLADGDDLELERGGIIIQVGECVGSRDQDLSDLIDKRAQERAQRQAAAAAARRPPTTPVVSLHAVKQQPLPQKHLHDVIGTPSGHHGRAVVPKESPYEERRQRNALPQGDDTRPAKRQRREKSPPSKNGYAQNLFGATLTLSGRPSSQGPERRRLSKASYTRGEALPPSSSNTGNHNGHPNTMVDAERTPTTPENALSRPIRQIPLQPSDARPSIKTLAEFHGSTRPVHSSYPNSETSKEPHAAPVPPRRLSTSVTGQAKDLRRQDAVLDSHSTSHNMRKLREVDETLEQAAPKIGQPNKAPRTITSKNVQNKKRLDATNNYTQGHRLQDTNVIDITEDPAGTPCGQPFRDEPRTELRIKPRKKRGLLMISEQHTTRGSSSKSERTTTRSSAHSTPLLLKTQPVDVFANRRGEELNYVNAKHNWTDLPKKTRSIASRKQANEGRSDDRHPRQLSCGANDARNVVGDDESDETQCLDQSNLDCRQDNGPSPAIQEGNAYTTEPCAIEPRMRLRPRKQPSNGNGILSEVIDGDNGCSASARRTSTLIDEIPAPRLAKLARRSIKSREVIGFIFDNKSDPIVSAKQNSCVQGEPTFGVQQDQGISNQNYETKNKACDSIMPPEGRSDAELKLGRKASLVTKEHPVLENEVSEEPKLHDNQTSPTIQTKEALSTVVTTTTTKQSVPMITNPATRGKKAAKPSDAAGKMPVCPLPTESVGASSLDQNSRKTNVQENSKGRPTSPMPGFSRINGGPWSREAHDLFEFKRPSYV
ncbi:hypothetical protein NUW58_g7088 [Xylaria curta]|uniref:Uncharacterized protein n=1 Tax=Xylaria curta TaxID=42375 RepID=A0ACC1NM04_9PEZI|nr:hypothetical protein NUW58_g7088 [Xylaria curta]